jgi:hypothetical protein
VRQILVRDLGVAQKHEVVRESRLGRATEIQDDFDERFEVGEANEPLPDRERKDIEELD